MPTGDRQYDLFERGTNSYPIWLDDCEPSREIVHELRDTEERERNLNDLRRLHIIGHSDHHNPGKLLGRVIANVGEIEIAGDDG